MVVYTQKTLIITTLIPIEFYPCNHVQYLLMHPMTIKTPAGQQVVRL